MDDDKPRAIFGLLIVCALLFFLLYRSNHLWATWISLLVLVVGVAVAFIAYYTFDATTAGTYLSVTKKGSQFKLRNSQIAEAIPLPLFGSIAFVLIWCYCLAAHSFDLLPASMTSGSSTFMYFNWVRTAVILGFAVYGAKQFSAQALRVIVGFNKFLLERTLKPILGLERYTAQANKKLQDAGFRCNVNYVEDALRATSPAVQRELRGEKVLRQAVADTVKSAENDFKHLTATLEALATSRAKFADCSRKVHRLGLKTLIDEIQKTHLALYAEQLQTLLENRSYSGFQDHLIQCNQKTEEHVNTAESYLKGGARGEATERFERFPDPVNREVARRILQVPANADEATIRKQWKKMLAQWHPDKFRDCNNTDIQELAEREASKINRAMEILIKET